MEYCRAGQPCKASYFIYSTPSTQIDWHAAVLLLCCMPRMPTTVSLLEFPSPQQKAAPPCHAWEAKCSAMRIGLSPADRVYVYGKVRWLMISTLFWPAGVAARAGCCNSRPREARFRPRTLDVRSGFVDNDVCTEILDSVTASRLRVKHCNCLARCERPQSETSNVVRGVRCSIAQLQCSAITIPNPRLPITDRRKYVEKASEGLLHYSRHSDTSALTTPTDENQPKLR